MACLDIESKLVLSTEFLKIFERVDCKRHAMFCYYLLKTKNPASELNPKQGLIFVLTV